MQIPFCGQSYNGRSLNLDPSRCINFYPELSSEPNAKAQIALIGTPGTSTFCTFESGEPRWGYNFAGRCFAIVADTMYEIYGDRTKSIPLVSFPDSTGLVTACDNGTSVNGVGGDQIFIITNDKGYIYNVLNNILTQITDVFFPTSPRSCAYLDGYFIVTDSSMTFRVSELYNGLTWPGLAFAATLATPDNVQCVIAHHQQLYFFKEIATEVWYNNGTPTNQGSPFVKLQGTVIDYGTPAPKSVVRGANSIFFLANVRNSDYGEFAGIAMLEGYSAKIISPPPINYRISKFVLSDAFAYCYTDEGHIFYVITFPTSDATFVYDITTGMWHERSTYKSTATGTTRHIGNGYTFFNGKHILTDSTGPRLLEMSSDYYDDNGLNIISERVVQPLFDHDKLDSVFISKLIVEIQGGVGDQSVTPADPYYAWIADGSHLADGSGNAGGFNIVLAPNGNPKAWLSWSNDNGYTWSNEYSAAMGKSGEYKTRLSWRRLGRARNRVFRLKMVDKVKKIILGAYIK